MPRGVRLTVYGDRFEFEPQSGEAGSDVLLTMHPQTYVLLLPGRLSWRRALEAGDVAVTGRREAADGLPAWFGQS